MSVTAPQRSSAPTVLLTSAGRRVSLLRAFAHRVRGEGGVVLAGDIDRLAPALFHADSAVRLPRLSDPTFPAFLTDVVERHAVDLVVPTIDTELPILAAQAKDLEELGCWAVVSGADFVALCSDKARFSAEFAELGFAVPTTWLPSSLPSLSELPEHLFVKPRAGSAGIGAGPLTRAELSRSRPQTDDVVIQERLRGEEITIDAFLDRSGTAIHYVPRARIRVIGGESVQGVTLPDAQTGPWIRSLLEAAGSLGARGPVTFQAFLTERGPVLLECNPRFGGGFPLGLAAGAHYPDWLVDISQGHAVRPRLGEYEVGVSMTRYYEETFVRETPW